MNCADCQDSLVAYLEGGINPDEWRQCQAHLESCAACRAEYAAISRLQQDLIARGRAASRVALAGPVMRRVLVHTEPERNWSMKTLFTSWKLGLGALAGAAVIMLAVLLFSPSAQATAADVLAKGARAAARINSVHLRGQLRTPPADNFSTIRPAGDFASIELWKEYAPALKWRVEKPGRVAVMDGQTTLLYIKPGNLAVKIPMPAPSAFDTDWLQRIANLSDTLENELKNAQALGWTLSLAQQRGADGRAKSMVTIQAKSNLPENDYLKNKFVDMANTRRVYCFDNETERLEAVQVYLTTAAGETPIFELTQIEYNQPSPQGVFNFELPADVHWYQEPQMLADNPKYAALTPEQAARAFFEACGRSDWEEVAKFESFPFSDEIRQYVGGLQIISLGSAFTSQANGAQFVPYEIKFKNGEIKKHNLALKKDRKTDRWFVDGGF